MKTYQIYDADIYLIQEYPIYSANKPVEALKKHLDTIGGNIKVKVNKHPLRFGVIPCVIENGKVFELGWKRKVWFGEVNP